MKKFIFVLVLLLIPGLAFAEDKVRCTLDNYVAGDAAYRETCQILDINTTTNIGNLGSDALTFDDVELNNVIIEDLTFLNNITAGRFIVINSKVNLDNLMLKAKVVFFQSSYIMGDDLSGLANNTILENLTFDNCWLSTLETIEDLKDITTFTTLTITANRYLHLNLNPILELPYLTTVNLNYMQQNVGSTLFSHFKSNGITVPGLNSVFEVGYPEDVSALSDYEKIRDITLWVASEFSIIDVTREIRSFSEFTNNELNIQEMAILLSYLLQEQDFKTAHIVGRESAASLAPSIYVMVYFNNRWNVINILALDKNADALEALRNGEETDLFMQDANTKFNGEAVLDERLIEYMDYSYHVGYMLPDGELNVQILPLDTTTYSLYEPNIDGYTFGGWFLDRDLTKPITNVGEINKTLILYGKFEANKSTPGGEEGNGNGTVTPPDTGMFMGIWMILPIVALIAIEWIRNKRFKSLGDI